MVFAFPLRSSASSKLSNLLSSKQWPYSPEASISSWLSIVTCSIVLMRITVQNASIKTMTRCTVQNITVFMKTGLLLEALRIICSSTFSQNKSLVNCTIATAAIQKSRPSAVLEVLSSWILAFSAYSNAHPPIRSSSIESSKVISSYLSTAN